VRTATDEVIHRERKITPESDRGAAPSKFLHTQNTIRDHIASDQVSFAMKYRLIDVFGAERRPNMGSMRALTHQKCLQ
jgi:hypothetical protein